MKSNDALITLAGISEPGTDVQRMMVWPATYGTFSPPEDSALATFGD